MVAVKPIVSLASWFAALAVPAAAQVTTRVSIGTGGQQGDHASTAPAITPDGRYVAFESTAYNLVAGDTNFSPDIFVRDRLSGTTDRVSVDSAGVEGYFPSYAATISADGRFVAFWSASENLVGGDTNATWDVFLHDRIAGTTERMSVDSSGVQGNNSSYGPSISANGRFVAFQSYASNLVAGDTNLVYDVFVRDRVAGTTERVSLGAGGVQAGGQSGSPSMSADGRYVAFHSEAPNLVPGDTNSVIDVFVRDRLAGTTERVSVDSAGVQGNGYAYFPSISADGRYVAFESVADNLVAGDTNGVPDVFVRDRIAGTTVRVSVDSSGAEGNANSQDASISPDGRYVVFDSMASNLVGGDANGFMDVFVRDRELGTTEIASLDSAGAQGNDHSDGSSVSEGGRFVALSSFASNLVGSDSNLVSDVFVRDRHATGFANVCAPGIGGVIACPCSNPPGGPGRGCDNSAGTGGAVLAAAGVAYLSTDSLVFTTSGERPTALSIVSQWIGTSASGLVFGMGVRCTSGTLKRLYTKSAVAGSITAPDFGAGELPVSARSAALGDTILAGQSRWYLVYYRDPHVLGGCPSSSTFNATQTGVVTWWP